MVSGTEVDPTVVFSAVVLSVVLVSMEDVSLLGVSKGGVVGISGVVLSGGVVRGIDEDVVSSAVVELETSGVVEEENVLDSNEEVEEVDGSSVLDSLVLVLVIGELESVVEVS